MQPDSLHDIYVKEIAASVLDVLSDLLRKPSYSNIP